MSTKPAAARWSVRSVLVRLFSIVAILASIGGRSIRIMDSPAGLSPAKIVSICPAGCSYASLGEACAAETSTAAAPIIYNVGPGMYEGEQSCGGEDHAIFRGAGAGTTFLRRSGLGWGPEGTFEPGNSTNFTVTGFTMDACHRCIWGDGVGGDITISNNQFITEGAQLDEDCVFLTNFQPGTRWMLSRNECTTAADGFTIGDGAANLTAVVSQDNRFYATGAGNGGAAAWGIGGVPCSFTSAGDTLDLIKSTGIGSATMGFNIVGDLTGCPGNAIFNIQAPVARIENTVGDGVNGHSRFIQIRESADELGTLHVASALVSTSKVGSSGTVYGILVLNSTTRVGIYGGRYRTQGGSFTLDFAASVPDQIEIWGADFTADAENDHAIARHYEAPRAAAPLACRQGETYMDTSGAYCVCTTQNRWTNVTGLGNCV